MINGDELRRKRYEATLNKLQKKRDIFIKEHNLEGLSESEIENLISPEDYLTYSNDGAAIMAAQKAVNDAAKDANLTQRRINEFMKSNSSSFNIMNTLTNEYGEKVDVIVSTALMD